MPEGVAERRPMTPFARASAAAVTALSTAPGEGRPPCKFTPSCHPAGKYVTCCNCRRPQSSCQGVLSTPAADP